MISLKLSMRRIISVFFLLSLLAMNSALGQESNSDTLGTNGQSQTGPDHLVKPQAIIDLLDFKNTDLRDVVRSIAAKYNLNIIVEEGITKRVTLHLVRLPVHEALEFIAQQYELVLKKQGAIYYINKPVVQTPPPPPMDINYKNARLSINVENVELGVFVKALAHKSGKNVVLNRGVQGAVSGFLQNLSFEQGLRTLMNINGFSVRENNGIFLVEREQQKNKARNGQASWVTVKDSLVSLHVTRANIREVLEEIFQRAGKNLVIY